MARPWPVLPEVGSMIVPPGRSSPDRSASSIIVRAIRSFTLPPGFSCSSLARITGLTPLATFCSRTIGVWPTRSRMLSENSTSPDCMRLRSDQARLVGPVLAAEPAEEDGEPADQHRGLAEHHERGAGEGLVDHRRERID